LDAERWLRKEGLGNNEVDFEVELLANLMAGGGEGRGGNLVEGGWKDDGYERELRNRTVKDWFTLFG
jgi:hypothetical protein